MSISAHGGSAGLGASFGGCGPGGAAQIVGMDRVRPSALRGHGRFGAYPVLAAAMVAAGAAIVMRWGPALPEMVLAADPVSDMEEADAVTGVVITAPYTADTEIDALTEPVEEVIEPELTDSSPELVDPAVTTGEVAAPPEVVTAPATTPAQTLPRGRWVLFDRNGQPVDAVVEPWCVDMLDDCPEFGAIAPSCVWIEYLGQLRVRVPFRLTDGDPYACYSPSGQDRASWNYPPAEIAGALDRAPYSLELIYWD